MATVNGTALDDTLVGTDGDDVIKGLLGDDLLIGLRGNDTLNGGGGTDRALLSFFRAPAGVHFDLSSSNAVAETDFGTKTLISIEAAQITGSEHDDVFRGGIGGDFISGAGGNDAIFGGCGDDTIGGGFGNDTLNGGEGIDSTYIPFRMATSGVHFSFSSGKKMVVTSDHGTDTLISIEAAGIDGSDHDDVIKGGAGNDTIFGYLGDDLILGGKGNDVLRGDGPSDDVGGSDTINGGQGDDYIDSGFGDDTMIGGAGVDTAVLSFFGDLGPVNFALGKNHIIAETGVGRKTLIGIESIEVYGSFHDDTLSGGAYRDMLYGADGNDILIGGGGDDDLIGDFDAIDKDTFVFNLGSGHDRIYDFQLGIDTFRLTGGQEIASLQTVDGGTDVLFADGSSVSLLGVTVTNPSELILV